MQTYSNCASSQLGPSCGIKTEQAAKDVLLNINRKQATKRAEKCRFLFLVTDLWPSPWNSSECGPNTSSVWIWCKSVQCFPRYLPKTLFLSLVTLAFVLDIQTHPNEGPNTSSMCLAQVHSAVPEIFHTQTENSETAPKAEPYEVCVR